MSSSLSSELLFVHAWMVGVISLKFFPFLFYYYPLSFFTYILQVVNFLLFMTSTTTPAIPLLAHLCLYVLINICLCKILVETGMFMYIHAIYSYITIYTFVLSFTTFVFSFIL